MKHLKMLGLFAMAAAALTAFAGGASAATFTAPAGTEYTGAFDMSLESSLLQKTGFAELTCTEATIRGNITVNIETEASGPISEFNLAKCGSATIDTLNNVGSLKVLKLNTEVRGTGVEVTFSSLGTSCVYGFGAGTKLGTASNTASGVTLTFKAQTPEISGGFLCASPAEWTGSFIFTTPTPSVVD
jgi:hypothetical protein